MKANTIIEMIKGRMCDDVLADIYVDKDKLSYLSLIHISEKPLNTQDLQAMRLYGICTVE